MSDMGRTVTKTVGGKEVICREVTVAVARKILQAGQPASLIDAAIFEEVQLQDLPILTSLTAEEIDGMRPSELRIVVDGCKEANPDFFAMLARVSKAQKAA